MFMVITQRGVKRVTPGEWTAALQHLLHHGNVPLAVALTDLDGFAGINDTVLTWDANPETDLSGYEVVTRETTAPDWTVAIPVGNVTSVTLDIAKDNLQFGVRAVDKAGHRSPVGFPVTVTT